MTTKNWASEHYNQLDLIAHRFLNLGIINAVFDLIGLIPMLRTACFLTASVLTLMAYSLPSFAINELEKKDLIVEDFNWKDRNHMSEQVERVDELARLKLGLQIRGDKRDLEVLQRIIHRGYIQQDDVLMQQALGAVLGNVMVNELGLEWKRYEDRLGLSRAACAPGTEECLFPVTMLSRRMSVGLMPNVEKVYNDAHELIKHLLPKSPYQVD